MSIIDVGVNCCEDCVYCIPKEMDRPKTKMGENKYCAIVNPTMTKDLKTKDCKHFLSNKFRIK